MRQVIARAMAALVVATCPTACGARSGLDDDGSPGDRPLDASSSTDAARVGPSWAEGVWWFGTVRAVCDTFAVEFCGEGEAVGRWSRDDGCLGEAPTTLAPLRARVVTAEADAVELAFDVPPGAPEPTRVWLRAATAPPVRALTLEVDPASDFIEFPWGRGRRPEDAGVPVATVAEFVYCD